MGIDAGLIARLDAAEAVTDIAGGNVFWGERPQGSGLPAVLLYQVSRVVPAHLKGDDDMVRSDVRADCIAKNREQAWDLADAVRATLLPPAAAAGVEFWRASIDGPRDLSEPTGQGMIHRAVLDMTIRHTAG